MNIALATEQDLPALPAIEQSAAQAFLGIEGLSWLADAPVEPVERHRTLMHLGTCWVARDELGQPVGFLGAEAIGADLHIWEVSVRLDHQGLGIGRALLQAAMEAARRRGLAAVTLTTFRDVPWNGPFYRRLGFREPAPGDLGERLRHVLDAEQARGLPPERRCAMVLLLPGSPGGAQST